MTLSSPILELENVHAAYLQKEILRGLSLTVNAGEIVALLGENGSGKSTTLKVIAGLLKPSQGSVHYRDRDIKSLEVAQRQQIGIGYLMQGGRVFPNLTVQENLCLATAQARHEGKKPSSLGDWFPVLRKRGNSRAGLLSGGQRQMLALEMVLAQSPELLLLDEPTGALSGDAAMQMLNAVTCYVNQRSAALILVEHVLTATNFATTQLYLANGALKSQNTN